MEGPGKLYRLDLTKSAEGGLQRIGMERKRCLSAHKNRWLAESKKSRSCGHNEVLLLA